MLISSQVLDDYLEKNLISKIDVERYIQNQKMASYSGGKSIGEFETEMDSSKLSDSDFLESETEGKKYTLFNFFAIF